MYVHRLGRTLRTAYPALASELLRLLAESPTAASPLRGGSVAAVPVDTESRLSLARVEFPATLPTEPVWPESIRVELCDIVAERRSEQDLIRQGVNPTRTVLFTGAPGMGKTLAARWLARELNRPLIILDLASVMSSFLGRTGVNVRHVLDYAKEHPCVLLLDELDAIAKRRDDAGEIGELKRLVTVLLQQLDDWPATGLLVAATNHASLLDPAVWRRFERVLSFPHPGDREVRSAIARFFNDELEKHLLESLACSLGGSSFSDIDRELMHIRRDVIVKKVPVEMAVVDTVARRAAALSREERITLALALVAAGQSQRRVQQLTGVSRETLRKHLGETDNGR